MVSPWFPIALSRDVPPRITRAVHLEGRELVIWRADGAAHVWEDRCPHRGMRLSFGFIRDNSLNCLYHGWQYGEAGSCVRIPAHPDLQVAPTIRANAYAATEAAGIVWVNLDPSAGAAGLPPLPAATRPVVSLAIAVDGLDADHVTRPFEGGTLHLFWHRTQPGRIMVHAVLEGPGDLARAAAFVRTIRNAREQGVAA